MFNEGKKIGSYTLIKKLGKGGFGEVWLAEKSSQFVTKRVAVKLPLDEQVNFDAIRQEATLWEKASGHANVLPIIDADIYDGQVVIVSEYADGGSLAEQLKAQGKLSIQQAVEMTIGILNGLQYLHSKQIIHRDIKPQNILLQGETPRLADFGISRVMQTTAVSLTIVGTDAYMSPETFDGNRSVQTDIWAVGVVLYQLLTGKLPFAQDHPTERMFAILMKDFDPLPAEIPNDLQNIIRKALAKNPAERYRAASDMSNDLKSFLYTISSPVKPVNPAPAIPVTLVTNEQNFPHSPTNEGKIAAETAPIKPQTAPQQQADTFLYNPQKPQLKSNKSDNSLLIIGAIAAIVIVLFGGILTAGYFVYINNIPPHPTPSPTGPGALPPGPNYSSLQPLRNMSTQDMELFLEDSSPEQLKLLTNPDKKKETVNDLKQMLAVAAEADAEGYSQKPNIKLQLEFIEKKVMAYAYDKRKTGNYKLVRIGSVSDEEAKEFFDKPGNEQRFKEFFENSKEFVPKDKQPTDKDLPEARNNWSKIEIAYQRALAENAGLSERERRETEIHLKIQQAQFLADKYNEEVLIPKLAATTEEIEDYKKNRPEYATQAKKAKAEQILQRAKNGEDFAKLANEFSEDPGAKNKGGLYVNVQKGVFITELEQAALALEPGQIAENLVETKYGYHIVKLIRKGETYDFRHILISTAIPDPDDPTAQPVPINDFAKNYIEEEKKKKFWDELVIKHKITVADDFKVPQNSTK